MSFSSVSTFNSINTHINNLYYVTVPSNLSLGSITTSSMVLNYTDSSTNGTGLTYYATTTPTTSRFNSSSTTMNLTGLSGATTYTVSLYATISQGFQSSVKISGTTLTPVMQTQLIFPNSSINYGLVLSNQNVSPANPSYPYYNASNVAQQKLTITGQSNSYLNGNYYAAASSWYYDPYNFFNSPDKCFTNAATSFYSSLFLHGATSAVGTTWYDSSGILYTNGYGQEPYNSGSPYAYRGGGSSQYFYTTTAGGTGYNGEWLQIRFPFSFLVTSITIFSRNYANGTGFNRDIALGYLLGSNDSSTWTLLYTINQATKQASYTYNTGLSNTYSNTYKYFRLVQNRSIGVTSSINIPQWYLTGYPYA